MHLEGTSLTIVLILCGIFALLLIIWLSLYLNERFKEIKYFKMEVKRAGNPEEYRRWKRKLRIAYVCLVPGLKPSYFKKKKKQDINPNHRKYR